MFIQAIIWPLLMYEISFHFGFNGYNRYFINRKPHDYAVWLCMGLTMYQWCMVCQVKPMVAKVIFEWSIVKNPYTLDCDMDLQTTWLRIAWFWMQYSIWYVISHYFNLVNTGIKFVILRGLIFVWLPWRHWVVIASDHDSNDKIYS